MSAARQLVAAQVEAENAKITAYPYPYAPEQVAVGRPIVSVYRERMMRSGANVEHHLKLDIFVSLVDGEIAEAEAENALDEVLMALQRMGDRCYWTQVERVNFADAFTGYTVTAVMVSKDPYKSALAAENRTQSKDTE